VRVGLTQKPWLASADGFLPCLTVFICILPLDGSFPYVVFMDVSNRSELFWAFALGSSLFSC
jgi:hypothetical protein